MNQFDFSKYLNWTLTVIPFIFYPSISFSFFFEKFSKVVICFFIF